MRDILLNPPYTEKASPEPCSRILVVSRCLRQKAFMTLCVLLIDAVGMMSVLVIIAKGMSIIISYHFCQYCGYYDHHAWRCLRLLSWHPCSRKIVRTSRTLRRNGGGVKMKGLVQLPKPYTKPYCIMWFKVSGV